MIRSGIILLFFLSLLCYSCREVYQPPVSASQSNLLVVDGFLEGADSSCTVVLSRSQNLADSKEQPVETGAVVQVQDDEGAVYLLTEKTPGNYYASNLPVDFQKKYRLLIKTNASENYQSDYVEMKKSPPIDSVTWKATDQGVQFYVNTHDAEKKSIYYQYRYVETWEYRAPFPSDYELQNGVVVIRANDVYHCWSTAPSTQISIATSANLSEDVINNFPFYIIPKPSQKYLIKYSILVKQNVLTADAYSYWQKLQKNTEKIGTLFDPQPSQVLSNVQNIKNNNEPVLGFFNAGASTEKRIFVLFKELPQDWYFTNPNCMMDTVLVANLGRYSSIGLISPLYGNSTTPYGYTYSSIGCTDCRAAGGTTTKPDFW